MPSRELLFDEEYEVDGDRCNERPCVWQQLKIKELMVSAVFYLMIIRSSSSVQRRACESKHGQGLQG
jgi:hypothetical protein